VSGIVYRRSNLSRDRHCAYQFRMNVRSCLHRPAPWDAIQLLAGSGSPQRRRIFAFKVGKQDRQPRLAGTTME